ncbi:MAG: ABC transporter permease, partial [Verrucomicrobia bacterium]|nr:ABC transporter permease [Verrucomicrobiota bacterium]
IGKIPVGSSFSIPVPFFILLLIAIVSAVVLNRTIWGRYLLALGRNETAARYSGINTDRIKIAAYMVCSLLAGVGGILFSLDLNSVQPSGLGEFYELYAIAAAVLGGCSLRGGEGTILGVIIGTAVMRVLYNAINILSIPTHLEFAIIGAVILAGVVTDELAKRYAANRRAVRERLGETPAASSS